MENIYYQTPNLSIISFEEDVICASADTDVPFETLDPDAMGDDIF